MAAEDSFAELLSRLSRVHENVRLENCTLREEIESLRARVGRSASSIPSERGPVVLETCAVDGPPFGCASCSNTNRSVEPLVLAAAPHKHEEAPAVSPGTHGVVSEAGTQRSKAAPQPPSDSSVGRSPHYKTAAPPEIQTGKAARSARSQMPCHSLAPPPEIKATRTTPVGGLSMVVNAEEADASPTRKVGRSGSSLPATVDAADSAPARQSSGSVPPTPTKRNGAPSPGSGAQDQQLFLHPIWSVEPGNVPSFSCPSGLPSSVSNLLKVTMESARGGDTMREDGMLQYLVLGPTSRLRILWDVLSVTAGCYDVLTVPLIAFISANVPPMRALGLATTIFWTSDIVLTFFSGFHVGGIVEMRMRKIAMNYIRHWFFLDGFIVFTDWILVLLQSGFADVVGIVRISKTLRLSRIFRLFRLLRVIKLPSLSEDISGSVQSETLLTVLGVVRSMAIIAVINHFIACGWYAIGNYMSPSWVDTLDKEDRDTGYRYVTALHWSLTQFTPASMEVVPRNSAERLFAIVVLFSALITFSTFISSITTAMTTLRRLNFERSKQRDSIRRYVSENRVSLELSNRITAFLRTHNFLAKRRVHESDIQVFKVLPEPLRVQLHWEVYTPRITPHPFFHHFDSVDAHGFLEICHLAMSEEHVGTCQELFTLGSTGTKMHFVQSGVLEYYHGKIDMHPFEVTEGQWVCEATLWIRWEHRGRLSAVTPSEFVSMDAGRFRAVVTRRPHMRGACREYAVNFMHVAQSWGQEVPPDIGPAFDVLLELAQQAFEHVSENAEAPNIFGAHGKLRRLWRSWSPPSFVSAAKHITFINRGNSA